MGTVKTPILQDSFTDVDGTTLQNHTADSGHNWIKYYYANSVIQGDQLRRENDGNGSIYKANVPFTVNDQYVKMVVGAFPKDSFVRAMLRAGSTSYSQKVVCNISFNAPVVTVSCTGNQDVPVTVVPGDVVEFRVGVNGIVTFSVNGTVIVTFPIAVSITQVGNFFWLQMGTGEVLIDNMEVGEYQ